MENKLLLKLLAQEKKGLGAPGSSHVAKERRNARRSKAHIGLVEPAHSQPGSGGSNVEAKHEGLKDHLFGEQMPMAHFMDNLSAYLNKTTGRHAVLGGSGLRAWQVRC